MEPIRYEFYHPLESREPEDPFLHSHIRTYWQLMAKARREMAQLQRSASQLRELNKLGIDLKAAK